MKGMTNKYQLINNVRIVLRKHNVVVSPENFNDTLAELILSEPQYAEAYGHNIKVLDEKTLEALKKRRTVTSEPLVFEIEMPKKKASKASTSTLTEASPEESKPKKKRGRPRSKSKGSKES